MPTPTPPGVTITSAVAGPGGLAVSAFIASVIEEGGTCTAVATSASGRTSSVTGEAFADVSSTICEPLTLAIATTGLESWQVTVTYRSADHEATSEPTSIEVK